jgi:hypothetical protein
MLLEPQDLLLWLSSVTRRLYVAPSRFLARHIDNIRIALKTMLRMTTKIHDSVQAPKYSRQ